MVKKLITLLLVVVFTNGMSSVAMAAKPTKPEKCKAPRCNATVTTSTEFSCAEGDSWVEVLCNANGVQHLNRVLVKAKDHVETDVPGKAATCTEKGLIDGKYCTICNTHTVSQQDIPALGHKEIDVLGKAATLSEPSRTRLWATPSLPSRVRLRLALRLARLLMKSAPFAASF